MPSPAHASSPPRSPPARMRSGSPTSTLTCKRACTRGSDRSTPTSPPWRRATARPRPSTAGTATPGPTSAPSATTRNMPPAAACPEDPAMNMMSDQINEIAAALAKAQGQIEGAAKGKVNPAFKTKYADLASVWDAAREPLSKNGLAVVQIPQQTPDGLRLITMLTHSSGQWFSSCYPINPMKADPQGIGSALTYA